MSTPMTAAADRLAQVLRRENDALRRMDLAAATSLLPDKQAALADMQARAAEETVCPAPLRDLLAALAEDNRVLLERAIAAQTRIVRMIARAAAPKQQRGGYRPPGQHGKPAAPGAFALSQSA